ncbi:MAG: hypothetical protein FWC89_10465 [Defluviitaleaceae bacterium]|nr:hypothetical protein [Defluviitaleaceae bacterium]
MRIIFNELQKIWNVRILLIIAFLCVVFYAMFMHHWVSEYHRFGGDRVYFAHHLTETYGTTLSQEDFEDFRLYREVILVDLDPFFADNPVFAQAGIFNFDDHENFREEFGIRYETLDDEERNLWYAVSLELGYMIRSEFVNDGAGGILTSDNVTPDAYNLMRGFQNIIGMYEINILGCDYTSPHIESFTEWHQLSERELQRLEEIQNSGELTNIMTQFTVWHTWEFGRQLAVLVILVTLVLVSSLVTTDRATRVNWLQYSSKQGRSILTKQLIAVLISAIGMTTILVAVFAGAFSFTNAFALWHNGINSFMSFPFHWLSITYGQYLLLIVAIIYVLGFGTAAFAFVLSRFSKNMIWLLFKVIPFFVAAQRLSNFILRDFLAVYIGGDIFAQITSLVIALIVGIIAVVIVTRREKIVDLM